MEEIIRYFSEECINKFVDLRMELYEHPENLAEFILNTRKETDELARRTVEMVLQEMNDLIYDMPVRKRKWTVERKGDDKKLMTTVGEVRFKKTLYESKTERDETGKLIQCYLLDKVLGLSPYQTMTEDAVANVLEETVQTSYRKGGEAASAEGVTKGAVKDLIHSLKFPENYSKPARKREVEYLYIEADEDHYHLQLLNRKGDLKRNENGRKLNGAISKLIYIHEGIEPEAPKSKRHKLINPHYFCRGSGQDNRELWEEVFKYIDDTYETDKIKRIYLSSDGGGWIKAGYRGLADVTFVLDEYHLSKYIAKLTDHMEDSAEDAKAEIYDCIRNKTKAEFNDLAEHLKSCTMVESIWEKIDEAANYIGSNWTAAKYRLKKGQGVVGSSTEGHVYHVLSSRMSTKPMGWSLHGGAQMAHLLEYHWNKGDMLELAKYQREELPLAAGAEEVVLGVGAILKSERSNRTKLQAEYGKYAEAMSKTITLQTNKQLWFQLNGKL